MFVLDGTLFCADADFDLRLKDLLFPATYFVSIWFRKTLMFVFVCIRFAKWLPEWNLIHEKWKILFFIWSREKNNPNVSIDQHTFELQSMSKVKIPQSNMDKCGARLNSPPIHFDFHHPQYSVSSIQLPKIFPFSIWFIFQICYAFSILYQNIYCVSKFL